MDRGFSPEVLATLAGQTNVISNWQVDERTRRSLQRACARGLARRLTWSVYLASTAAPTVDQLVWAAHLHCGPDSMIAGRSAMVLAGWRDVQKRPIHVLVPASRQPRGVPDWMRVHRSQEMPARSMGSLPRVPPHPAALQAAAWAASDREVMYVLTSAMQQGVVAPRRLQAETQLNPRLRRRQLTFDIAAEYLDGMQSVNEIDFAGLCRRHRVPQPVRQTRRLDRDGHWRYTDAEFLLPDGRILIVEIDGLHHLNRRELAGRHQAAERPHDRDGRAAPARGDVDAETRTRRLHVLPQGRRHWNVVNISPPSQQMFARNPQVTGIPRRSGPSPVDPNRVRCRRGAGRG